MRNQHRTTRTTTTILEYVDSPTLPCPVDELAAQAATYRALLAMEPEPAPEPVKDRRFAIAAAVDATTIAATKGGTKANRPDLAAFDDHVAAIDAHQRAQERHATSLEVLTRARDAAAEDLAGVLHEHGRTILAELQTYLDAMVAELRTTVAPKVANLTTLDALKAGDDVREAYERFEAMCIEYATMRSIQQILFPVRTDDADFRGEFEVFRNAADLYRPVRTVGMTSGPPWPTTDAASFLLWVAAHPTAELWLPTTEQRDAEHQQVYPPRPYRNVAGI